MIMRHCSMRIFAHPMHLLLPSTLLLHTLPLRVTLLRKI
jgi:hypothetical protein